MDVRGMHYDVKQKLNKVDSEQYRNLRVPEIDWNLNEACEIFVKSVAEPRTNNFLGFETSQRSIDDIRTIVVNGAVLTPQTDTDDSIYVELPDDYMFYISSEVLISKPNCGSRVARGIIIQHDDRAQDSPFDVSSFEWGEVNIRFYDKGIKIFTDGTFTIDELRLNYIRKHAYIHDAQDFLPTGSYTLPDGTILAGSQNCELPEHTHREIVDIAVLIITGNLQIPDYQVKQAKINLNN
jgi:hypothetical protein